jgi:hypothetical protein
MTKRAAYNAGDVIRLDYPFRRDTVSLFEPCPIDGGRNVETETWIPGARLELTHDGDTDAVADGVGEQILTVISTHKPDRYPLRIFYTRQWITPDGKQFGKTRCRVTTASAFAYRARGYRHEYRVEKKQQAV